MNAPVSSAPPQAAATVPPGETRGLRVALLAGVVFFAGSVAWDYFVANDHLLRLLPWRAAGVVSVGVVAALTFAIPSRPILLGALGHASGGITIAAATAILPYGYGYGVGGMLLCALGSALAFRDGRSSATAGAAALLGAAITLALFRVPADTAFAIAFFAVPGFATAALIAHSTGLRLVRERHVRAELAGLREDLRRFGTNDALTGVHDDKQLTAMARREISLARRRKGALSALKIDVDGLSTINDRYGRSAGDETLRAVASMCQAALRETDLLARLGGDDFVAVLPDSDERGARTICDRLQAQLEKAQVLAGEQVIQVSVLVAATTLGTADKNLDDLLVRADAILQEKKAASVRARNGASTANGHSRDDASSAS